LPFLWRGSTKEVSQGVGSSERSKIILNIAASGVASWCEQFQRIIDGNISGFMDRDFFRRWSLGRTLL